MFGLAIDREPLSAADFPEGVMTWFQVVGGFALFGLVLWFALGLPRQRAQDRAGIPGWLSALFVGCFLLALAGYLLAGLAALIGFSGTGAVARFCLRAYTILATGAGALAVLAVALPIVRNLPGVRFRRVFALARLSFKEAVRRRILYAFAGVLLVFLFASWFIALSAKPSDETRTYVATVFLAMELLLLPAAVLVSAFSIPTDIKNQTIHTIVTKPVERFEIVLGRFLGFFALLTLVLVVMTGVSLLYVFREVNPEAAAESLKAREPLYGELRFENTDREDKATNVGREWDYRSYITRPQAGQQPQTARWDFPHVPAGLASRKEVPFEYTFDVYRTTKGEKEGADVSCTVRCYSWRFQPGKGHEEDFRRYRRSNDEAALRQALDLPAGEPVPPIGPERDSRLAEKYGFYEILGQPVTDYHTQSFHVPGGLFKNITTADPDLERQYRERGEARPPDLRVKVTCESVTQYVGMARYDLYARLDDPRGSEKARFAFNFFKASFGLWLKLGLAVGLAVVLSTYLSGVISLLVVVVLLVGGTGLDFIKSVALGTNVGGGPGESMLRIFRRELTGPDLRESTATADQLVARSDETFRWVMRRTLRIIPDVNRFKLDDQVAEGFNIPFSQMGWTGLLLLAYLVPWFMLSYYLIHWREIASAT
jgi:hypothetical protein